MFVATQERVCLLGGTQLQTVEFFFFLTRGGGGGGRGAAYRWQLYSYKKVGVQVADVFGVEGILLVLMEKLLFMGTPVWPHLVIR
jgi:hypothetical protein